MYPPPPRQSQRKGLGTSCLVLTLLLLLAWMTCAMSQDLGSTACPEAGRYLCLLMAPRAMEIRGARSEHKTQPFRAHPSLVFI